MRGQSLPSADVMQETFRYTPQLTRVPVRDRFRTPQEDSAISTQTVEHMTHMHVPKPGSRMCMCTAPASRE